MLEFVGVYSKNTINLYPKIEQQWLKNTHYLSKA